MSDFSVRTAEQLPTLLQAFRKQSGLTQAEVALRLGVTQQTLSALERNADKVGAGRLLELLAILGVELILRDGAQGVAGAGAANATTATNATNAANAANPSGPDW